MGLLAVLLCFRSLNAPGRRLLDGDSNLLVFSILVVGVRLYQWSRFLGPALCGGRAAAATRSVRSPSGLAHRCHPGTAAVHRRSSVIAVVSISSRLQGSIEFSLRLEFRGPATGVLNSCRLARGGESRRTYCFNFMGVAVGTIGRCCVLGKPIL